MQCVKYPGVRNSGYEYEGMSCPGKFYLGIKLSAPLCCYSCHELLAALAEHSVRSSFAATAVMFL